jgi:hypothetical protein
MFALGSIIGAVIVCVIWLATVFMAGGLAGDFDLTGDMTLIDDNIAGSSAGASCHGTGGYSDLREGTSVTVYGAAGTVIATGALGKGTFGSSTGTCTFSVLVPNVPGSERFYQVEVSHRGKLTLQADEAKSGQFGGSIGR